MISSSAIDEMQMAVARYRGPIRKCPAGMAYGANDLHEWGLRRANGWSGVAPDEDEKRRRKEERRDEILKMAERRQPKRKKPITNRQARNRGLVIWRDTWPDAFEEKSRRNSAYTRNLRMRSGNGKRSAEND